MTAIEQPRAGAASFLTRRRGKAKADWTDWATYGYLVIGLLVMFGPVLWLVLSSFKSPSNLAEFPPTLLPYEATTASVEGFEQPLELFDVTLEDGSTARLAQIRRVGLMSQMIDPANPQAGRLTVPIDRRTPIRSVSFATQNYTQLFEGGSGSQIATYVYNSLFITIVATLMTIIMNSMAAFALSKYRFRGDTLALVMILAVIMIPATVILVPVYLIVAGMGLSNNLWGVILPTVATPTGVFLLRQYMLTIPDELLEAARMDHASEWRIFWRIILPLSAPALAVVAIFSIMSRWNDFLLPLIVLARPQVFTLQLALNQFQAENTVRYDYLLSMTTLTALPVALVFIFLQRFITSGIATTGVK